MIMKAYTRAILVLIAAIAVPRLARAEYSIPFVSESDWASIATDLEIFADSLDESTLSNKTALSEAIVAYLESHGPEYFGATVTFLDDAGRAEYSPYVYHDDEENLIQTDELMDPSYGINERDWLKDPIEQGKAIWTQPYFDQGGGNVWMRTRSNPIFNSTNDIIAVATTDIRVDEPDQDPTNSSRASVSLLSTWMAGAMLFCFLLGCATY